MTELTLFLKIYICALAGIIGLVMGSFLNCAAIRITTGEPIARGRSHCMACGHLLGVRDLVPLFSWLFLKGKCRYCGQKISARYPLSELCGALIYILIVLKYGLSLASFAALVLFSIALCIAFADIEDYLIPDRLIAGGIILRILLLPLTATASGLSGAAETAGAAALSGATAETAGVAALSGSSDFAGLPAGDFAGFGGLASGGEMLHAALQSLIGGLSIALPLLIIVLIMDRILKKESMGGGDIKLFFMLGLYFPWQENILALLLACIVGIVVGLVQLRGLREEEALEENEFVDEAADEEKSEPHLIPFGPAIVCGYFLTSLFGSELISWYLGLF